MHIIWNSSPYSHFDECILLLFFNWMWLKLISVLRFSICFMLPRWNRQFLVELNTSCRYQYLFVHWKFFVHSFITLLLNMLILFCSRVYIVNEFDTVTWIVQKKLLIYQNSMLISIHYKFYEHIKLNFNMYSDFFTF